MRQLKKTILTLVALLAVTTGAWAQEETLLTTITPTDKNSYSETTPGVVTVTHDNNYFYGEYGWIWMSQPGSLKVEAKDGYTITRCVFSQPYDKTPVTVSTAPFKVNFIYNEDIEAYICEGSDPDEGKMDGVSSIEVYGYVKPAASSGPEVAWDKTAKTGSFTMPGGNVTLEPEYYPQAALAAAPTAINDVPATTDGAIVEAGTVKNIGETTTAQGTLMYYVSPSALDDAALLALAADQWTADVPTATHLAQGQAYVYYYVRGNDGDTDETTFSDGDILSANAFTVNIAAEPTYAVTFADGTDLNEWTADPAAGVTKGQPVTVTYNGSKKVIGVKAEKKAKAATISFTVMRATAGGNNSVTYTVDAGTTWQQFIESGNAPASLSIGTSGYYNGKVCHDMDGGVTCCGGTLIANVADKKRVKASDAIIDGATYGCSDYLGYEDHD